MHQRDHEHKFNNIIGQRHNLENMDILLRQIHQKTQRKPHKKFAILVKG